MYIIVVCFYSSRLPYLLICHQKKTYLEDFTNLKVWYWCCNLNFESISIYWIIGVCFTFSTLLGSNRIVHCREKFPTESLEQIDHCLNENYWSIDLPSIYILDWLCKTTTLHCSIPNGESGLWTFPYNRYLANPWKCICLFPDCPSETGWFFMLVFEFVGTLASDLQWDVVSKSRFAFYTGFLERKSTLRAISDKLRARRMSEVLKNQIKEGDDGG